MGCPISQSILPSFWGTGNWKLCSVIFTFQCVLGVALEIKFIFTTQNVFLSYFRMAGFFYNHRTNMTKTRFTRNAADVAHCFLSRCLRGWTLVDKPVCKAYTRPWLVPSWWNNGVKEAAPCLQHQVDPSETMWKKMSCAHQVHWADSTDISAHKVFWNCSFHCPVFRTCQRCWQLLCQFMDAEANVAVDLNVKICHLLIIAFLSIISLSISGYFFVVLKLFVFLSQNLIKACK